MYRVDSLLSNVERYIVAYIKEIYRLYSVKQISVQSREVCNLTGFTVVNKNYSNKIKLKENCEYRIAVQSTQGCPYHGPRAQIWAPARLFWAL